MRPAMRDHPARRGEPTAEAATAEPLALGEPTAVVFAQPVGDRGAARAPGRRYAYGAGRFRRELAGMLATPVTVVARRPAEDGSPRRQPPDRCAAGWRNRWVAEPPPPRVALPTRLTARGSCEPR